MITFYIALVLSIIWILFLIKAFVKPYQEQIAILTFFACFISFLFLSSFITWYKNFKRKEITQKFAPAVQFEEFQPQSLPVLTSWAKKRGFGDFNGDGIDDMIEIRDRSWVGLDFLGHIFYGQKNEQGKLVFQEEVQTIGLPNSLDWLSSKTKLNVGDINGDGYCDIIFSQFQEGLWKEDIKFAFALNNHQGEFWLASPELLFTKRSFKDEVIKSISRMLSDDEELLDNWFKMDWADMNGDGSDDFILMWWTSELEVMYTQKSSMDQLSVIFDKEAYFRIHSFLSFRDIKDFDAEDFDGDGKADLFIQEGHKKLLLSVAFNRGKTFEPHQDFATSIPSVSYFNFRKFDTFDVNLDGKADLVKVGRRWGKPMMFYKEVIGSN